MLKAGADDQQSEVLTELIQRMTLLEKKIDYLQRTVSPNRPVMEMHEVCRMLKLRPKAVNELVMEGILPTREQGKKTVFYEDEVMKYFVTQNHRKGLSATNSTPEGPVSTEPVPTEADYDRDTQPIAGGNRRIGINAATELLDRSAAAIYQLINTKTIPYHKEGRKVYFFTDELLEWRKTHPAKKRKAKR